MAVSFTTMFPAPLEGRPRLTAFTEAGIVNIVTRLGLGRIVRVDIRPLPDGRERVFVHLDDATPIGKELDAALLLYDETRARNESMVPKRIYYSEHNYHQIYRTRTIAEVDAARAERAAHAAEGEFVPRIG